MLNEQLLQFTAQDGMRLTISCCGEGCTVGSGRLTLQRKKLGELLKDGAKAGICLGTAAAAEVRDAVNRMLELAIEQRPALSQEVLYGAEIGALETRAARLREKRFAVLQRAEDMAEGKETQDEDGTAEEAGAKGNEAEEGLADGDGPAGA